MTIGICSDHAGYELKEHIKKHLEAQGITCKDFGAHTSESSDYADFAHSLAAAVEADTCYPGIAICGSGNGVSMALNKHQNIRAAICWSEEISRLARSHNDANVLVMPARFIDADTAAKITNQFLATPFEGGRHQRRIEKIPIRRF